MNLTEAMNFLSNKIASALSTTLINKTVEIPQEVFDGLDGIESASHFHAHYNAIDGISHFVRCVNQQIPNTTSIINLVSNTTSDALSCYINPPIDGESRENSPNDISADNDSLAGYLLNPITLGITVAAASGGALLWYLNHNRKNNAAHLGAAQPEEAPSASPESRFTPNSP